MALYTIGDLHLSFGKPKPMDKFGQNWKDHPEKLLKGFEKVNNDDVTVICGDLTWAMDMESAKKDFLYINALPGKKIILKGNHDYWWSTASKANKFFAENGIDTIEILNNNSIDYGEYAICGTRGWFYEEEMGANHDKKIMLREIGRLENSLKAGGEKEKLVFLHYPPLFQSYECPEILELLKAYNVRHCYYGHIHGKGCYAAFNGWRDGTQFQLVSADAVNFSPIRVI